MKRQTALEAVAEAVLKDRQNIYGPPENSFGTIALFVNVYLDARMTPGSAPGTKSVHPLLPHDVAAIMMLVKIARIACSPSHIDNWIDSAGYAVCGAELAPVPDQAPMGHMPECNTAADGSRRPDYDVLTEPEAIRLNQAAHMLKGVTVRQFTPEEAGLLTDALLRPTTVTWKDFCRVAKLAETCGIFV